MEGKQMADAEHVAILKRSVDAWDEWRELNPEIVPDLSDADLSGAYLNSANLSGADLCRANLAEADLSSANLSGVGLIEADLRSAKLRRTDLTDADLSRANLENADLHGACLVEANFTEADLAQANLCRADLRAADLTGVILGWADLKEADLRGADLCRADLTGACLRRANLGETRLHNASLPDADLREANLCDADLSGVMLAEGDGRAANLSGAKLIGAHFTDRDASDPMRGFLELAAAKGLELADFGDPAFLYHYLAEAFDYVHQPNLRERERFPQFIERVLANIRTVRQIYGTQEALSGDLIEVVQTITTTLIKYLRDHPNAIHTIKPRQFEELVGEILSSYGWDVVLTPSSKDGGYDLYAIVKNATGVSTSWIVECKKYAPENKVGVDIVRGLWGIKQDLRVANAMLATTSYFTKGAHDFKSSRYDLALRDYEGILEWINEYHPNPDGKLYIRDHCLVLPGEKPPRAVHGS